MKIYENTRSTAKKRGCAKHLKHESLNTRSLPALENKFILLYTEVMTHNSRTTANAVCLEKGIL